MNWYVITKTAADMDPNMPSQWEQNPDDPRWSQWQRMERQRQFQFMSEPDRPYQRQYKDPDADQYGYEKDHPVLQGGYLYHVTTNLSGVKITGGLKSRRQLKDEGQTSGLGGGVRDEAANLVSLTYDYGRAKHIYDEFQFVAAIVIGKVKASEIYDHVNGYRQDMYDLEDQLSPFDQVIRNYGVSKKIIFSGDEQKIKTILDAKITTPQERYDFFRELETAVLEQESADNENSDYVYEQSVIGFTAGFEAMSKLNPANIAILQCVLRKDSAQEHVMHEQEIRALPEDLAVIRYMQPNPGR